VSSTSTWRPPTWPKSSSSRLPGMFPELGWRVGLGQDRLTPPDRSAVRLDRATSRGLKPRASPQAGLSNKVYRRRLSSTEGGDRADSPCLPRRFVRTPNFAPDGSRRPAQTQLRTAVSRPLLARRKPGVQIPSPPPHKRTGHRPGGSPPPGRRRSRFPYRAATANKRPTATRLRPGDGAKRRPTRPSDYEADAPRRSRRLQTDLACSG
jgi:hypothetical protein